MKALRERFAGHGTPEAALKTLRKAGHDRPLPPILRMHTAAAVLELKAGRSVQSTMARFRRAVGLDSEKRTRDV